MSERNRSRAQVAIVANAKTTLGRLLGRLGPDAKAGLDDGRVFVGRKRATSVEDPVEVGEEIVLFAPRVASGEVVLLGERDGIVAVAKPAALASVADRHGRSGSLAQAVVEQFGSTARQWEPTSRLDVGVSGVVLFVTRPQTRVWLAGARERGEYQRHYIAIATHAPLPASGNWTWPIGRAGNPFIRQVGGREPRPAHTRYALRAEASTGAALLAVEPQTGRTHQIRVHAAQAGCALVGDAVYGGMPRITLSSGAVVGVSRIGLHAAWVQVPVPSASERWMVQAPVGADLHRLWDDLGGDGSAWSLACDPC